MFCCEICEIFMSTFFVEHLQTVASVDEDCVNPFLVKVLILYPPRTLEKMFFPVLTQRELFFVM